MLIKRPPLYHNMLARGAQMFQRPGFDAPMFFTSAREEHLATRESAGLFEIFGQFLVLVEGPDAVRFCNETFVADFSKLADGQSVYCAILNDAGGFRDDVICMRDTEDRIYVIPGPGVVDAIEAYLQARAKGYGVCVVSLGYRYMSLSIQGPKSRDILRDVTDVDVSNDALKPFRFKRGSVLDVPDAIVSRTGFSGELGFEVFFPTEFADHVYDGLLDRGSAYGLVPCGLQSLVSLRIEKKYPIMGRDIDGSVTPVEAGLGWTVRTKAEEYPGKAIVEAQKAGGPEKLMVLMALEAGAETPVGGEEITVGGRAAGRVTTAAMGHSVGKLLAIGFVLTEYAQDGQVVEIGGFGNATVSVGALYDPTNARVRS